jgi:hypothetical protein
MISSFTSSGRTWWVGSSKGTRPHSAYCSTATAVTILVHEAIAKVLLLVRGGAPGDIDMYPKA